MACVAGYQRSLNGDVRLDLIGAVTSVTVKRLRLCFKSGWVGSGDCTTGNQWWKGIQLRDLL